MLQPSKYLSKDFFHLKYLRRNPTYDPLKMQLNINPKVLKLRKKYIPNLEN